MDFFSKLLENIKRLCANIVREKANPMNPVPTPKPVKPKQEDE